MHSRRNISSNLSRLISIVIKNPSWLLGKCIEQEWNNSPGMNNKYNGKVMFERTVNKVLLKLIISYWTVEEIEDDGEDDLLHWYSLLLMSFTKIE